MMWLLCSAFITSSPLVVYFIYICSSFFTSSMMVWNYIFQWMYIIRNLALLYSINCLSMPSSTSSYDRLFRPTRDWYLVVLSMHMSIGVFLTYMMAIQCIKNFFCSIISGDISTTSLFTGLGLCLVLFPFSDPILGPKQSMQVLHHQLLLVNYW